MIEETNDDKEMQMKWDFFFFFFWWWIRWKDKMGFLLDGNRQGAGTVFSNVI